MKELTFKEVINEIKEGETWKCKSGGYAIEKIIKHSDMVQFIHNSNGLTSLEIEDFAIFIKQETLVTFEEVLKSDKECKVEHDIYDNDGKYKRLDILLRDICNEYTQKGVRDIIRDGKWYLSNC